MKWEQLKLGDIADITSSKRVFANQYVDQGVPFYRQKEIIEKLNKQDLSDPLFISEELYNEIKRKFGIPQKGDLLITAVGALGIPYLVDDANFYFKDGNLIWLKNFNNNVCSNYLYYWIRSDLGQKIMSSRVIGSAQAALTIEIVKQIMVDLPPLTIQNKIVEILAIYDHLIENNQKQIKLLEEAAQRLYKEWFVDLRFPGHENVKIVDGVPEGWSYEPLSEFAYIEMGQSPKSEYYNLNKDGLPFHQGVGSYGNRFVKDDVFSSRVTKIGDAGSILFSVRAPVGRINLTRNRIVIGRGLAAINHKRGKQSFLFYKLKQYFFKEDILGNGSIFASINKNQLMSLEFLMPSDDLINKFDSIVREIDKKIDCVDSQIEHLQEARDRLLPKLMSGEIEV